MLADIFSLADLFDYNASGRLCTCSLFLLQLCFFPSLTSNSCSPSLSNHQRHPRYLETSVRTCTPYFSQVRKSYQFPLHLSHLLSINWLMQNNIHQHGISSDNVSLSHRELLSKYRILTHLLSGSSDKIPRIAIAGLIAYSCFYYIFSVTDEVRRQIPWLRYSYIYIYIYIFSSKIVDDLQARTLYPITLSFSFFALIPVVFLDAIFYGWVNSFPPTENQTEWVLLCLIGVCWLGLYHQESGQSRPDPQAFDVQVYLGKQSHCFRFFLYSFKPIHSRYIR